MAGEPYNPTQQPVCTCGLVKETTDQKLDRIIDQYEWANKQFIDCPNGDK